MLNFKVKQFVKIIMQNIVFPFFYRIGKIAPVDDRLVIFADSHHDDIPYSIWILTEKRLKMSWKIKVGFTELEVCRPLYRLSYGSG